MSGCAMQFRQILLVGSIALCAAAANAADIKSIERAAHGAYVTAINSNDVDTLLADLTDDIVYQSPGEPEIVGKAAVRKWLADYFGASRTRWEKTSIGFVVSGDWAFERYTYRSTDTDRKTGAVTRDTGKGINIFRRGSDDRWRVAIDGWSSDQPPPATEATRSRAQRLPTIAAENYSREQKQAADEFLAARHTPVFGPFEPMMYSPQLMSTARAMGDYLRYKSAIGNTLSELVILMTARAWRQDYEWQVHYPIALKAGIRPEVADSIAKDRRPTALDADGKIVFDYVSELLRTQHVSDRSFERAKTRFGPKGVVDIAGIVGYYTLLAMELNAAEYPAGKTTAALPAGGATSGIGADRQAR